MKIYELYICAATGVTFKEAFIIFLRGRGWELEGAPAFFSSNKWARMSGDGEGRVYTVDVLRSLRPRAWKGGHEETSANMNTILDNTNEKLRPPLIPLPHPHLFQ